MINNRRTLVLSIILIMVALVVSACASNPNVPSRTNPHPSTSSGYKTPARPNVPSSRTSGGSSSDNRNRVVSKVQVKPSNVKQADYSRDGIILPPYTIKGERHFTTWYQDGNHNLGLLEEVCDYNSNVTKSFANQLAARSPGMYSFDQVCEIFAYLTKNWRYVCDPQGQEYAAKASESIFCCAGDCDDYAILMCSCILAIGGNADIVLAESQTSGHAYSELDITNMSFSDIRNSIKTHFPNSNSDDLHYRTDNLGRVWLNLDWQAEHPGGPYYNAIARDYYYFNKGSWTWISGNK